MGVEVGVGVVTVAALALGLGLWMSVLPHQLKSLCEEVGVKPDEGLGSGALRSGCRHLEVSLRLAARPRADQRPEAVGPDGAAPVQQQRHEHILGAPPLRKGILLQQEHLDVGAQASQELQPVQALRQRPQQLQRPGPRRQASAVVVRRRAAAIEGLTACDPVVVVHPIFARRCVFNLRSREHASRPDELREGEVAIGTGQHRSFRPLEEGADDGGPGAVVEVLEAHATLEGPGAGAATAVATAVQRRPARGQ
mmetsp:Transcript_165771/g.532296  ORF Transcript_165771/g.532296 Transcript_165771/m.532296 type:complete len:253 (-) Transcript_165771:21-779(-)